MSYSILLFVCGDTVGDHPNMREWLSGGARPCQGRGRGFESRLALSEILVFKDFLILLYILKYLYYLRGEK